MDDDMVTDDEADAYWRDNVEILASIASDAGLRLVVGGSTPGEPVGDPPASAKLCDTGSERVVWIYELRTPTGFEQVLHEIAHHVLGMRGTEDEEAECYRWAAVQALRLPVEVSTEVARMAKETTV